MNFSSIEFLTFFCILFLLYWVIFQRNVKWQNLVLLAGGYLFYAWSDLKFLSYLVGASAFSFYLGRWMDRTTDQKKKDWLLYLGLFQGLGGLLFFKYFNFFILSFREVFQMLGLGFSLRTLNLVIPLGISFFTFRTVSYLIDVHKGKFKAVESWVSYFTYVSFFPSIMAGPIDKARDFIPQLEQQRRLTREDGFVATRQITWGLFKKVVIADNCAAFTNQVFGDYKVLPGSSLLFGIFIYTIQMYADFSGYSDMAIGLGRLLGFRMARNFDFPFFARNIAEFWRKWHISLTTWLTEYLFTPLSILFRDFGKLGLIGAIIINFVICGMWHGANWTFILWGFLHGCYFIPLILRGVNLNKSTKKKGQEEYDWRSIPGILGTFSLVMLTLIFFRSDTVGDAFGYLRILFSNSLLQGMNLSNLRIDPRVLIFIIFLFFVEYQQKKTGEVFKLCLPAIGYSNRVLEYVFYFVVIWSIILWGNWGNLEYIYVQF